jgi:hypothetical protein
VAAKSYLMKKTPLIVLVATIVLVAVSSCGKVIDAIFPGVDAKVPDIQLTVPIIPIVPPNEISLGTYTVHFNLDSTIKTNTGGVFGVAVISSVKIKEIAINVSNADNINNLSNFEYARVTLGSNTNTDASNIANLNFPDTYASSLTVTPNDSPELIDYLKGSQLTYTVYGKARRPTTKPLNMTVSITVRVK